MNNALFNKLKKELIEIYSNEDTSAFDVGKIITIDHEWGLFQTYDNYGLDDGIMLLRMDAIYKIHYNTNYIKDLMRLIKEPSPKIHFDMKGDLFSGFIEQLADHDLVSVTLSNGCSIIGKITDKSDAYLQIDQYLNNGLPDGTAIIFKDSITCMEYNTAECRKVLKNIEDTL